MTLRTLNYGNYGIFLVMGNKFWGFVNLSHSMKGPETLFYSLRHLHCFGACRVEGLLGGSWVVISEVISPLIWIITIVILHITLLITTHEP